MIGAVFGKSSSAGSPPRGSNGYDKGKGPPAQGNVYYQDPHAPQNHTANGNPFYHGHPPPAGYPNDPAQQQQYYAQQQQQYYMQQQQQQQQQQQAYYGHPNQMPPGGGGYPQHGVPPQDEKPPSKKSLFPGRASARGAALISSMRNLSLGGALRNSKKEAHDWEKQWDADEDDDESDEEEDAGRQGVAGPPRVGAPPLHAMRPGMDTGHSDLSTPVITSPPPQTKTSDKAYFVTPEAVYDAPASPPHTRNVIGSAPSSPTVIPIAEDDGVEWDTGQLVDDAKPEIQMFLPMLRVLGKGSFGKVR
jgi:hypothetical protein